MTYRKPTTEEQQKLTPEYRADCRRRDGDPRAARVAVRRDGTVLRGGDGSLAVVYPWLLADIF